MIPLFVECGLKIGIFFEICHFFFQTQQTSYASQYVKECKTHYKKACWVDLQDIFTTKKVTICTTRPENKCQRSIETGQNEKKVCKPFHETGEI